MNCIDCGELKNEDIRNVDEKDLVDIKRIHIDSKLPIKMRVQSYISQIKNPYCYKSNGMVIKLSFSGKKTLSDAVKNYILTSDISDHMEDDNKIASA